MTTMGIIFANIYDSSLGELTNKRTMASLPYGGRYRQIDFSLSNMTNSAIRHIGIITKYNYQSLMNHIGSGQEWDLELGEGGLEFLTPFAMGHNGSYRGKLEALDSAMNFLKISTEEYVVLADSGVLCAINLEKIVEAHAASGADVTVVVKDGICNGQKQLDLAVKVDADDRVTDVAVDYCAGEQYLASMGLFVIRRELLMREVTEAVAHNRYHFERDLVMHGFAETGMKVNAYRYDGVALFNESTTEFFHNSLALIRPEIRHGLFAREDTARAAAATLREKKVSDLKNRTKLANETAGGLLISIHQNSMPDHPSVHGAQVFYNGAASGPRLGETVQAALNGAVNAGNGKNAKAIDSTIYLMKNVQCPAILVECGFLSNRTETGQLLTGGYQLKLAVCIAAGFLQHDTEGASA